MFDEQKHISAQAIMKELIAKFPTSNNYDLDTNWIKERFQFCMKLVEDYATIPESEEFVSTNISVPKQFWNLDSKAQADWLTEWGKPLPVVNKVGRKEWFVFAKRANIEKVIKVFNDRDNNFDDMVKTQEKKI